jgi:hypothetical protein
VSGVQIQVVRRDGILIPGELGQPAWQAGAVPLDQPQIPERGEVRLGQRQEHLAILDQDRTVVVSLQTPAERGPLGVRGYAHAAWRHLQIVQVCEWTRLLRHLRAVQAVIGHAQRLGRDPGCEQAAKQQGARGAVPPPEHRANSQ